MTDTLNCIELPQEVYDTIDESINNLKTKSLKEVKEFATDLDVKFNKNASIERMLDLIQVKLIDNAREEAADRAANAQHIAKVSGMSARERDLLHQAQTRRSKCIVPLSLASTLGQVGRKWKVQTNGRRY